MLTSLDELKDLPFVKIHGVLGYITNVQTLHEFLQHLTIIHDENKTPRY